MKWYKLNGLSLLIIHEDFSHLSQISPLKVNYSSDRKVTGNNNVDSSSFYLHLLHMFARIKHISKKEISNDGKLLVSKMNIALL